MVAHAAATVPGGSGDGQLVTERLLLKELWGGFKIAAHVKGFGRRPYARGQ